MLRLLLDRPRFRRLWLAGTLSLVGDWLSFVAISLLALDRGGGPFALVVMLAVHTLPQALLMPVAGVVADRFDRRAILVTAAIAQALLTVAMAFAAWHGAPLLVQALVLLRSAATAFVPPAETAVLRHTVRRDELVRANTLVAGTWSLTFVVGMPLGGALAMLGAAPAIALDALTFALAAILLRGLPPLPPAREASAHAHLVRALPGELAAAFQLARANPPLFRAVFAKAPVGIAGGAGWVAMNVIADRSVAFGTGAVALGVIQAVRGAGTALGPITLGRMRARAHLAPTLAAGTAFIAIALFPMVEASALGLLAVALLWGMGSGANWVLSSSAIQRLAPDSHIGRLASLDELGASISVIAGAALGAVVLDQAGAIAAAWAGAIGGALAWMWLATRGASVAVAPG